MRSTIIEILARDERRVTDLDLLQSAAALLAQSGQDIASRPNVPASSGRNR